MTSTDLWITRFLRVVPLALLLVVALAPPADAQYFGRNKVQYRTFDFRVLHTEHFDIYYYPEEEAGARDAARMAERWYTRLSRILDYEFEERQPVVFYANHAEFQQTNTLSGSIGEGTGGVTEAFKQRVVMPLTGSYQETDHVLGHELVHAFQYDISGLGRAGGGISQAAQRFNVPLWFVEGMAEYLSVGPVDAHTAMWLRDAALTGDIPSIEQLSTDPRIFPYRYGHALWAYIAGRWGDAVIGQILKQVGQGVPFPAAFQQLLNVSLDDISEDWQAAIRRAYLPMLAERPEAREVAEPLITQEGRGGRMNVAPALSPDGQHLAFLSEMDFFDVELWLANAETGEVERKLVKGTSFDPHFGSLRFIASAGTFSPDGRQFAFSALRQGRDVMVILDVERARIVREIELPDVPEITNPTWSPDGNTIAFSATQGGISDLYVLDLNTDETRQLTDDVYADLMPSFSPDGQSLAFVTDRGPNVDLGTLRFGGYNIAVLDVASGDVRLLPQMTDRSATGAVYDVTNFNPQWTRDGRGIFFVSNRTGIPNVYRLDLDSGELFRVTELFSGVAGITALSPVMTAAQGADRLIFNAYEEGGYNLYAITDRPKLEGTPISEAAASAVTASAEDVVSSPVAEVPEPAVLPPAPRPTEAPYTRVASYLTDAATGLPDGAQAQGWTIGPYTPGLGLDYLGQPQVGFSTGSSFARGGVYGGIAGVWSDLLGRHTVFGALQAQGQLDEIGFSSIYLYRRTRWNLGAAAHRIPYVSAGRQRFIDQDGLLRDRVLFFRNFDWSLQGLAQYPFSLVQRVEFSAGLRRIARDVQIREVVCAGAGACQFNEEEIGLGDLNLFESSAALVYDNALLSYTSPFAGQRYRFEISPTLGDLDMVQGLADYRRYLWLRPFTLAVRGFHFGRYGGSADDRRLGPLFLGYSQLMRGYDYGDLRDDCLSDFQQGNPGSENCSVFDQLFGSKLLLANFELRFPLIRALVIGPGFGFPPIEGFAFFDAGVAWGEIADPNDPEGRTIDTRPVFGRGIQNDPGDRGILTSGGVGARVNVFGYLILEVDYVNAFERDRGWHWQFAIQPGF